MDQYHKWMRRAVIVLLVMNMSSLYSNWRLISQLRAFHTTPAEEVRHAADAALQAQ